MADQNGCTIRVVRKWQTPSSTISEYTVDDADISGYMLEEKGPSTTLPNLDRRIPAGSYSLMWHSSARFKKILPKLFNDEVPASRQILIHRGNSASDTEGCLLPGTSKGPNHVNKSGVKVQELIKHLQACDINSSQVIITEEFS
ncbi:DUF5675 family protein [Neptunomonas phycophila]|uniref:DUF5675 family protein n=1 Tax=Neptunomonas phycophila TaxID=1572645 RepID=A0AAW7XM52_9GAMM|nr:DUF5675 family protein [Neptunomonas phycophila]MDO6455342.1 DUF5675 family protein [Neptunomonas phycophila]